MTRDDISKATTRELLELEERIKDELEKRERQLDVDLMKWANERMGWK